MCRQPEECGRHMECACYFDDKVSAIGRQPPVNLPPDRGADAAPLAFLIHWPCEVDTAKMTLAYRTLVPVLVGGREEPRTP